MVFLEPAMGRPTKPASFGVLPLFADNEPLLAEGFDPRGRFGLGLFCGRLGSFAGRVISGVSGSSEEGGREKGDQFHGLSWVIVWVSIRIRTEVTRGGSGMSPAAFD